MVRKGRRKKIGFVSSGHKAITDTASQAPTLGNVPLEALFE